MAPPIPVLFRSDIQSKYSKQLSDPEKYDCQLKSLTQHQCTFKVTPDRSRPPEIICLPFKRIFQSCLVPTVVKENGKKKTINRRVNIEITDKSTNSELMDENSEQANVVQDFLNAEKEFRKLMEMESEGNI
ncbi:predicted protein [Scheffersomyces stipitis CBS 6054]|uniref:Uncharacterized protein n=1 Tax=Scheffersomyces stipitis (strain ATCC 58785 / CBS 6054 / NBRC 10063 / NRRL Y-11545) TaxID=322104 RepID=A3GI70_PICST|nr:predicted protein [Scheffersomyces stipitis CBS 6054]EAZ63183.1 predicted protein [Scheffersomyces stipitis CBS 6054]KAG2735418.1 hypothetical protein G9P44_001632 [Scheffersomyces stipitis]